MSNLSDSTVSNRSSNFSREELQRLQGLIDKYAPIILNKKTDSISASQKEKAWTNLAEDFNAGGSVYRSVHKLKLKFNNMKKAAKKESSNEKKGRQATGGGSSPPRTSEMTEWILGLMPLSFQGLPSVFDSDVRLEETPIPECGAVDATPIKMEDVVTVEQAATCITEHPSAVVMDSTTPRTLLRTPPSLRSDNKKRKASNTTLETKRKICELSASKTTLTLLKIERERQILKYAGEEHASNMATASLVREHLQEKHVLSLLHSKQSHVLEQQLASDTNTLMRRLAEESHALMQQLAQEKHQLYINQSMNN